MLVGVAVARAALVAAAIVRGVLVRIGRRLEAGARALCERGALASIDCCFGVGVHSLSRYGSGVRFSFGRPQPAACCRRSATWRLRPAARRLRPAAWGRI